MVLQAGDPDPWPIDPLARRLDAAYYALTRTTERHFGRDHEGWFLTGVDGLDALTMNRAVIEDAHTREIGHVVSEATGFFADRASSWSVVLASFRDTRRWHADLVLRGMQLNTTLDVLAREPAPIVGPVPRVEIRLANREEVPLFTEILMEVFRMPRRFFPALLDMTDAWRRSGARLYFGLDDDGEPASTALVSDLRGVAGVYNVGTLRRARRRGHARALMARIFEETRDAEVLTLQVAPEGFVEQFYLDLGFAPVYHWKFYAPRLRLPLFGK